MLTYAEELLQEGKQEGLLEGKQEGLLEGKQEGLLEGEIKGKVEMIEGLLNVGVDWTLITAATGIDPTQFQALKAQLTDLAADE